MPWVQVTDEHFEKAAQNQAQQVTAPLCITVQKSSNFTVCSKMQRIASSGRR